MYEMYRKVFMIAFAALLYVIIKKLFAKKKVLFQFDTSKFHKRTKKLDSEEGEDIRINGLIQDQDNKFNKFLNECPSLYEAFQRSVRATPAAACLGYRSPKTPFTWLTYSDVNKRITSLGSGLASLGIEPNCRQHICILCDNVMEWVLVAEMCYAYNHILVAVHNTFMKQELTQALTSLDIPCIDVLFLGENECKTILELVENRIKIKFAIKIGNVNKNESEIWKNAGVEELFSFEEVMRLGNNNIIEHTPPKSEDIACTLFTPGVVSNSKVLRLTHYSFIANVASLLASIHPFIKITSDDSYLSVIPLSHLHGQLIMTLILYKGAKFGFVEDPLTLIYEDKFIEELEYFRPTILICPRRIQKNLYVDNYYNNKESVLWNRIVTYALKCRADSLKLGRIESYSLIESFVFGSAYNAIGGRVRLMMTGYESVAPLQIDHFLCSALPCLVIDIYGMCEYGIISYSLPNSFNGVGPPIPFSQIKLDNVGSNGCGEILVKGPSVFHSYVGMDSERVYSKEDWLITGDIGEWLSDGSLKVIGKKKFIAKLNENVMISFRLIEDHYLVLPIINHFVVFFLPELNRPVAIVCPSDVYLRNLAKTHTLEEPIKDLLKNRSVTQKLENLLRIHGYGLPAPLQLYKFIFVDSESFFSTSLTPFHTVKRNVLEKNYSKTFQRITYAGLRNSSNSTDLKDGEVIDS